jgi:hypothetical protein
MIRWVGYNCNLYWARRARDKFAKQVDREWIEWVKKDPKLADKEEHYGLASQEMRLLDDRVERIISDYWIWRADRTIVELPPRKTPLWTEDAFGKWTLSASGVYEIRKKVWEVGRERNSTFLPQVTALFAVIGGLWAGWQATRALRAWVLAFLFQG